MKPKKLLDEQMNKVGLLVADIVNKATAMGSLGRKKNADDLLIVAMQDLQRAEAKLYQYVREIAG